MTVAVYVIALIAYIYVGYGLTGAWLFLNMDNPNRATAVVGAVIILALWATGLWFGTVAYF